MPDPLADRVWQATFSVVRRHARRRARARPAALAHPAAARPDAPDATLARLQQPDHRRLPRGAARRRGAADHGIPHRSSSPTTARDALRFAEVGLRRAADGLPPRRPADRRRHPRRAHRRRSTRTSARPSEVAESLAARRHARATRPRSRSRCTRSTPPHDFVLRSIELFATEVAPALGWAARSDAVAPLSRFSRKETSHDRPPTRSTSSTNWPGITPGHRRLDELRAGRRPVTRGAAAGELRRALRAASTTPSSPVAERAARRRVRHAAARRRRDRRATTPTARAAVDPDARVAAIAAEAAAHAARPARSARYPEAGARRREHRRRALQRRRAARSRRARRAPRRRARARAPAGLPPARGRRPGPRPRCRRRLERRRHRDAVAARGVPGVPAARRRRAPRPRSTEVAGMSGSTSAPRTTLAHLTHGATVPARLHPGRGRLAAVARAVPVEAS